MSNEIAVNVKSGLIPFGSAVRPRHMARASTINDDLSGGMGASFTRVSIKGKQWTVVRGKQAETVMNPLDPSSPATFIEVVILRASNFLSRTFFGKKYEPGTDAKPDCSSDDGITPRAGVPNPQATSCAACKWSVYGSGTDGRGFRCQNFRLLAIAQPDNIKEPMLLKVPGASLAGLKTFHKVLDQQGRLMGGTLAYNAVMTKLRFDPEAETPKIIFEPIGILGDEQAALVEEQSNHEDVYTLIGMPVPTDAVSTPAPAAQTPAATPALLPPVVETPVAAPVVETPVAAPVVETPVAAPVVETPVVETPVAAPVVEAPPAAPVVETPPAAPAAAPAAAPMSSAMAALFDEYDDE